jgi:hypothetical protein
MEHIKNGAQRQGNAEVIGMAVKVLQIIILLLSDSNLASH